jgi:hypothetical protein
MKRTGTATPRRGFVLRPYRRIPSWYGSYYLSGSVIGKGVVMNVSCTGLRVLGDHSLKPGTDVSIRVTVDTGPPLEISRASVRWVKEYEFGLKIDQITSQTANRLVRLIQDSIDARPSPVRENA